MQTTECALGLPFMGKQNNKAIINEMLDAYFCTCTFDFILHLFIVNLAIFMDA